MKSATQELIVIEQLPVITEKLKEVSKEINARISAVRGLECTEATVKEVKALRAGLNKEFADFEERRKAVKSAIMTPYDQFEIVYKEYVSGKYKEADSALAARVAMVEDGLKEKKAEEIRRYFAEYAQKWSIDFVTFEQAGITVTLSASPKSLKEKAQEFIDGVCDDMALIETQEHRDEIMVEFRRTLNCSQAITSVVERHNALVEQAIRRAEQDNKAQAQQAAAAKVDEAAPLAPPQEMPASPAAEDDPIRTLSFRVTAPVSRLKELKQFLIDGGFEIEQ